MRDVSGYIAAFLKRWAGFYDTIRDKTPRVGEPYTCNPSSSIEAAPTIVKTIVLAVPILLECIGRVRSTRIPLRAISSLTDTTSHFYTSPAWRALLHLCFIYYSWPLHMLQIRPPSTYTLPTETTRTPHLPYPLPTPVLPLP